MLIRVQHIVSRSSFGDIIEAISDHALQVNVDGEEAHSILIMNAGALWALLNFDKRLSATNEPLYEGQLSSFSVCEVSHVRQMQKGTILKTTCDQQSWQRYHC